MAAVSAANTNHLGMVSMAAQLNPPSGISITPVPQQKTPQTLQQQGHSQHLQQQQHQQQKQQQQHQHQQHLTLQGILRNTLSQPSLGPKPDSRQPSPHSTQQPQLKKESSSPTPSWHIPQTAESSKSPLNSSTPMVSIPSENVDNSFKIVLGSTKNISGVSSSTTITPNTNTTTSNSNSNIPSNLPPLTRIPGFRSILPKPSGNSDGKETSSEGRLPSESLGQVSYHTLHLDCCISPKSIRNINHSKNNRHDLFKF